MCSAADRSRLDALLKRCKRYGYCDKNLPAIADMFSAADDQLFERVNSNAGLWLRHSRQMPRAYDVEGAYERWLQNMLNRR